MVFSFLRSTVCVLVVGYLSSLVRSDQSTNPDLVAKLRSAGSQIDRLNLLPNDATDWTFDFNAQPGYTFKPASVVSANIASFPVRHLLRNIQPLSLTLPLDGDRKQAHHVHDPAGALRDAPATLSSSGI